MARNTQESTTMKTVQKATTEDDQEKFLLKLTKNGRPTSMIVERARMLIPANRVADIISSCGLDLRWSRPSTPAELRYVEQYVLAKYPEYSNHKTNLYMDLCIKEEPVEPHSHDEERKTPRGIFRETFESYFDYLERIQLEPSRLLDVLTKKTSYPGSFASVPEIQARIKVLEHCGLPDEEYLVLFTSNYSDAMMLVGESYPFFKSSFYMTAINQESDQIRAFASYKESKVIATPATWLDLRIKGSQLSQYFRRKSYHRPKGLFSFQANVDGICCSMHWISEAHRCSWQVLLDATSVVMGKGQLKLALHKPDFVLCNPDNLSRITCLLVRRRSFETTTPAPQNNIPS